LSSDIAELDRERSAQITTSFTILDPRRFGVDIGGSLSAISVDPSLRAGADNRRHPKARQYRSLVTSCKAASDA